MSSNRELLKAGKVGITVVGGIDSEFPWERSVRSSPEVCRAARLAVVQRVLDGKLRRGELLEVLDELGLR